MCFSNSKDNIYFYNQKNIFIIRNDAVFKIKDKKNARIAETKFT